jgi:hypothetical protein
MVEVWICPDYFDTTEQVTRWTMPVQKPVMLFELAIVISFVFLMIPIKYPSGTLQVPQGKKHDSFYKSV